MGEVRQLLLEASAHLRRQWRQRQWQFVRECLQLVAHVLQHGRRRRERRLVDIGRLVGLRGLQSLQRLRALAAQHLLQQLALATVREADQAQIEHLRSDSDGSQRSGGG